jgi:hypothetical protein
MQGYQCQFVYARVSVSIWWVIVMFEQTEECIQQSFVLSAPRVPVGGGDTNSSPKLEQENG